MNPPPDWTMVLSHSRRLMSVTNAPVSEYRSPAIIRIRVCMVMIDMHAFSPCPDASPTRATRLPSSAGNTS